MPVPAAITDLSATPASNSPVGSVDVPSSIDDYQRTHAAFIRQLLDGTISQVYTAFTTGGSSTAYTLTPSPAITAYAAGQAFDVTYHTASGAAPTLQISSIATPPNLVKRLGDGTLSNIAAGDIPAGTFRTRLVSATQAEVIGLPFAVASPGNGQLAGTRNKIINGGMQVDQRNSGAAQTFTAAAALAYSVDRWYGYCTGANVNGQQLAVSAPELFVYQFTGAASVTAIGFGQRIERKNCTYMAGQTATLSVKLQNSLLTTVTWTAYYATTNDTFGTLGAPTKTQIATGTFTVTSTLTRYSTQIAIPSAATTGIEILFTVGAQTSGTWQIGAVQLELGSVATPFERTDQSDVIGKCQHYYQKLSFGQSNGQFYSTTAARFCWGFPVVMRVAPTLSIPTLTAEAVGTATITFSGSSVGLSSVNAIYFDGTGGAPAATQFQQAMHNSAASVSAEL